jgi:hypothetical protein
MDQGAAPAAPSGKAFRQHANDCRKVLLSQRPVRPRSPKLGEEFTLVPVLSCHFGDDLLRQDIERRLWDRECIKLAAPHAIEQRYAFHEIVARQRKQAPLGGAIDRMAGTADPLSEYLKESEIERLMDAARLNR